MTWRASASESFEYGPGKSIFLGRVGSDGMSVVVDMTFKQIAQGEIEPKPVLHGEDGTAFLQAVMDAAYDAGLRPSRSQDERHQKEHLNDLRKIAFHVLKIDKQ
jgi:hypothetical protein